MTGRPSLDVIIVSYNTRDDLGNVSRLAGRSPTGVTGDDLRRRQRLDGRVAAIRWRERLAAGVA